MKNNFSCSLYGKMWWKPFVVFIVLFLAVFIPLEFALAKIQLPGGTTNILPTALFIIVMYGLLFIINAIFSVILYKIAYPTITVRNNSFSFTGSIGEFVKINIVGFLLILVTVGFYTPWYTKRIASYIVSHSQYDNTTGIFLGKGKKLLKYFFLGLVIPLVIWCILIGILSAAIRSGIDHSSVSTTPLTILSFITVISVFVVLIPFLYLVYKWYFNINWKNMHLSWDTKFWASCFFILRQMLLLLITMGIYWPAFCIKLYRYFSGKTILTENQKELFRFGFEGKTGKGFCLLWGQTLLSLITLGIFLPWAYANCARYFINNTYIEDK